MGGEGSGRHASEATIVRNLSIQRQAPITTDFFLPNYSGVKPEALKTSPTNITGLGTKFLKEGSDCAGGDGTTNRTLTLTQNLVSSNQVVLGRSTLIENVDYTKAGAIITFLVEVFDDDKIQIIT